MMASALSLYWLRNSSAPEKAIWLINLSTSSAVMPMPWSETVKVFFFLSMLTRTRKSPNSPFTSPTDERVFNFWVASTALLISSRRKISWSLYKNFFMTGNILSEVTPILPLLISLLNLKLSTLYTVHCTPYTIHCTPYTILQFPCHKQKTAKLAD